MTNHLSWTVFTASLAASLAFAPSAGAHAVSEPREICIGSGEASVLKDSRSAKDILFKVKSGEPILELAESRSVTLKTPGEGREPFVKVEFPRRGLESGWVERRLVKAKGSCLASVDPSAKTATAKPAANASEASEKAGLICSTTGGVPVHSTVDFDSVDFTAAAGEPVEIDTSYQPATYDVDGKNGSYLRASFPNHDNQSGWVARNSVAEGDACPTPSPGGDILAKYSQVDPKGQIPKNLLKEALSYYDAHYGDIRNKSYLGVVDFKAYSGKPRFYVVQMSTGQVRAMHVAHGEGSDPGHSGFAKRFSNRDDSDESSLGVYVTAEVYDGKHGRSVRLDGKSPTNSNARDRDIVMHEAAYVSEADVNQGRSDGCLALASSTISYAINYLKDGAVIYAGLAE